MGFGCEIPGERSPESPTSEFLVEFLEGSAVFFLFKSPHRPTLSIVGRGGSFVPVQQDILLSTHIVDSGSIRGGTPLELSVI
jgi:hypothetical protein